MFNFSQIPFKDLHGSNDILPDEHARFHIQLAGLISNYKKLWHSCSGCIPDFDEQFTPGQQKEKEEKLDDIIIQASSATSKDRMNDDPSRFHRVKNAVRNSLFQSTGLFNCSFDEQTREKFSQSTDDFIRMAKKFNPAISGDDVYQALRNVWIINSIQLYLGRDVRMTPSCFAYSMLYPYTDNALDAPHTDKESKRILNKHFTMRLAGIPVPITNSLERDVFRLFEIIEEEFDRSKYPHVYDSLLSIQHAQTRSVTQQNAERTPFYHELLDISIEKGGTSVLADGYLVAGDLSADDAGFLFGYGVFLQFIDDLQDLMDDLNDHQLTLVGINAGREYLDGLTNSLLVFTQRILARVRQRPFHEKGGLGELIERSCRILVLEAIARHHTYYTPEYVRMMERNSPVSFEYFRQLKNRFRQMSKHTEVHQTLTPNAIFTGIYDGNCSPRPA